MAHNALYFRYIIHTCIHGFFTEFALTAQLVSEINAACQLAHHHEIRAFQYFRLQRRSILQTVKNDSRTQVGEQSQRFADAKQPGFRTQLFGIVVPFRSADRTQQHGIRTAADLQRILRKRCSPFINGNTAKQCLLGFKSIAEQFLCFFQYF
ncbi:hypothetical protein D3C75_1039550 [compost metagenome]